MDNIGETMNIHTATPPVAPIAVPDFSTEVAPQIEADINFGGEGVLEATPSPIEEIMSPPDLDETVLFDAAVSESVEDTSEVVEIGDEAEDTIEEELGLEVAEEVQDEFAAQREQELAEVKVQEVRGELKRHIAEQAARNGSGERSQAEMELMFLLMLLAQMEKENKDGTLIQGFVQMVKWVINEILGDGSSSEQKKKEKPTTTVSPAHDEYIQTLKNMIREKKSQLASLSSPASFSA